MMEGGRGGRKSSRVEGVVENGGGGEGVVGNDVGERGW